MNSPKISIITPSYNQGQFIEETILSVINQNYPLIEYIIIDGGSTDNTIEIIKKYTKHITYWVSEKDSGQSEAINKGFKRATGDIVCWLNSDDILMPNAIREVANFFEENNDVNILNGYTVVIDKKSNILFNLFLLNQKKWYACHGIYYIAQPSLFWRRKIFESIGLLREDFHTLMDKEFLIKMFEKNMEIRNFKKILAGFRLHESSKTTLINGINGTKEKEQKNYDQLIIKQLYGEKYVQNPKLFFKTIYRMEKLFKGIYFKSWLFTLKWRGKNIKDLYQSNCRYI